VVVDEGTVIGLWEWHPIDRRVVYRSFRPQPAGDGTTLDAAAAELGAFIGDELGDLKQSSLDTQKSQLARVAAIETLHPAA